MRRFISIIVLISLLTLSVDSYSQLQVTANNNATQLAQTLAGAGVTVSNAALNCPGSAGSNPCGTFVGTASNIGIAGGVLLTNGDIINAVGPNNNSAASTDNSVTFNDPDLMTIDNTAIYDVCILQFDVKPSCDTLGFTFSFGSEEYPEYVGSMFNDAFGIFVTGPNPSGPAYTGYNMALIPSTTTPVSVNNVNNGTGGFLNTCPPTATTGPCMNCAYYVDNCSGTTVQYDGFTKPITVKLPVTPCGSYHLKLAIADAGDGAYDSGVFFALQSLVCNTTLTIITTTTTSQCTSNNGTATVTSVTGGAAPYTYSWSTTPVQTTPTATGLAPGNYTVTAIDANGCLNGTQTVTIASTGGFTTTSAQNNAMCFGSTNATASVTATGGNTPYTYVWSTNPVQTTQTANNLSAGNYTCAITDATGCVVTNTFTITQPLAITVTTTSTPSTCTANNGTAAITNVNGGTSPYTYSWSTSPVQHTQTATGLAVGTYTALVTDASGCSGTSIVSVVSSGGFSATISSTPTSCPGGNNGTAMVNPAGGTTPYTYLWNNGQTTQTATGLTTGTYTAIVTDANGCSSPQTVTVTSNSAFSVTVSSTQTGCTIINGTATATPSNGVAPYTYNWTGGQTTQMATGLAAGNYTTIVTDANGCTQTQTVIVTAVSNPNATATAASNIILLGNNTQLTASGGGTYQWAPSTGLSCTTCSNPTATPGATTDYCVLVTDANDCTDSACITIYVEIPCGSSLFLPDAFSPNNDGNNDYLQLYHDKISCITSLYISIYDRWGQKVFESTDLNFKWDGYYNGKPENTAVFIYYFDATLINGNKIKQKGNISLIR